MSDKRAEQITRGHTFEIVWRGGRLADISIDGHALACVEVGDWDWVRGSQRRHVFERELAHELASWIDEHADETIANELPPHTPAGDPEFTPDNKENR